MAIRHSHIFLAGLLAASASASPSLIPVTQPNSVARSSIVTPENLVTSVSKPITFGLHRDIREVPPAKLRRREDDDEVDDIDVAIYNFSSVSYNIVLDIGTPSQPVKVIIDTGSSELWVNPNCARAQSKPQQQQCMTSGHYNVSESSTGNVSQVTNQIQYGIGAVSLRYVSDNISLPGSDVKLGQVIFGDAIDSHDMNQGILGLSFGYEKNMAYRSLIDEMVDQEIIDIRGFGMALGSLNKSDKGVLTLGGIDTKKFSGKLHTEPIIPPSKSTDLWRYWVKLGSVGLTLSDGEEVTFVNSSMPVFFDSGSTLSYLPSGLVKAMADELGASWDASHKMYSLDCQTAGTVHFTFGDFDIEISVSDFLWDVGAGKCYLGVESSDTAALLGDSFLRSVYAVYDMDTPAIHFAPYVNCGSNAQMIPAGANKTASFEGECPSKSQSSSASASSEATNLVSNVSRSTNEDAATSGGSTNADSSGDRPIQSALMAAAVAIGVLSVIM